MAVILEGRTHRYIGLSTDIKPEPGQFTQELDGREIEVSDIPPGSSFLESDTGVLYHWTGRDWLVGYSPEVLELREIKGLLASIAERLGQPGFMGF